MARRKKRKGRYTKKQSARLRRKNTRRRSKARVRRFVTSRGRGTKVKMLHGRIVARRRWNPKTKRSSWVKVKTYTAVARRNALRRLHEFAGRKEQKREERWAMSFSHPNWGYID